MIVNVQVSLRPNRASGLEDYVRKQADIEIEPEFLPCLDTREIASKLTAQAFEEYLALRAEADEQEAGK